MTSSLRTIPTLLAAALLLSAAATSAQTGRLQPRLLVSPEELAETVYDPETVVLHVGRDRADYEAGHLPGARYLPLSAIVVERDDLPNELPPVERLDSVFESVGVSDGSRVVLYGDLEGLAAARAFFTLDWLGHARVALLDGGLEAWRAEGRPLSTEAAEIARGSFTPHPRPLRLVDAEWLRSFAGTPGVALIDARPEEQYAGEEPGAGVPRPGHIPGAANVFWKRALESDLSLRDPDELRALLAAAGVRPGSTVVTYCRTGVQASHAYFVARYLGYDARMYDGSFLDWSRRPGYPVER